MSFSVEKVWYGTHFLQCLLRPFSWGYRAVVIMRRFFLQHFCQKYYSVPVIVVGNITVGGVGKTPLAIALAHKMQQKGLRVGIISRGYGASIKHFPYEVSIDDPAFKVGDEPLLLAKKTNCPVVIAPKRNQAIDYLLAHHQSQIIISDDGLKHYRMCRTVEIAVIDGTRGLGNGLCLPAGPLREPAVRLNQVDFIIMNEGYREGAYSMMLKPATIKKLSNDEECDPAHLKEKWQAVAAIGNPKRFYSTLRQLGIKFKSISYPDHYHFKPDDLKYGDSLIIMTEKDAVKCREFCSDLMHYLPVDAVLSDAFWDALSNCLTVKGYANYV